MHVTRGGRAAGRRRQRGEQRRARSAAAPPVARHRRPRRRRARGCVRDARAPRRRHRRRRRRRAHGAHHRRRPASSPTTSRWCGSTARSAPAHGRPAARRLRDWRPRAAAPAPTCSSCPTTARASSGPSCSTRWPRRIARRAVHLGRRSEARQLRALPARVAGEAEPRGSGGRRGRRDPRRGVAARGRRRALLERWEADAVLISRGEDGMALFQPRRRACASSRPPRARSST